MTKRPRFLFAVFLAVLCGSAVDAFAQSVALYAPVTRTTGISYSSIAGTGSSFDSWRNGASHDDNRSSPEPIGFTFYYDGAAYTEFSVSLNGFLDLSASTAMGAGNGAYGYSNAQFSAPGGTLLALAPLYDDLQHDVAIPLDSSVRYEGSGVEPDRVLTVEWVGLEAVGFAASDLNFQVKLYESDGHIEFIYGSMTTGGATYSYTCGINGPGMSSVPEAEQLLTQQTDNSADFGDAPQNALSTLPASFSMLSFVPAEHVSPEAPALITFTDLTQTSMTVGWTDSSSTETYFVVSRSTDGIEFDPVASVPSTTTADSGSVYAIPQNGLTPGETYQFRITANNEASAPSPALEGTQAVLPPGDVIGVASGAWSNPATWSSGAVPQATDDVAIADGDTVTIDTAAECLTLTVGQGASGALVFEAATARTLAVGLGVTVEPGAAFTSAASGSVTGHQLVLGGDLVNDGTLDFSTNGDGAGASIRFTGSADASFTGAGATTDLRSLAVDKGTDRTAVLELSPAALTVRGATTDVASFVTLQHGTLRIGGTFTMTNRLFSPALYLIPSSAGLWLDNPNFTVAGQSSSSAIVSGLLRISQGTYRVGTGSGMSLGASPGAEFRIEGGVLDIAGRLGTTAAITYAQTGGTVMVCTAGNTASNSGSFDLASTASTFDVSGGTLVLAKASSAASPLDYKVSAALVGTCAGMVQFGSASSAPGSNFHVIGAMPHMRIDDSSGPTRVTLFSSIPSPRAHDVMIPPGCTLDLSGFTFTVLGDSVTNEGAIVGAAAGGRLLFQGTAPQIYTGSGTASLDTFTLDNSAGLTIDAGVSSNVVALKANLNRGTVTNSGKLTLGNGSASPALVQIGKAALASEGGSFDAYPGLNLGSGGYEISYFTEGVPRTSGFEIPASRTVSRLTLDNANGLTLAGGGLTLTTGLTLTNGLLHADGSNTLALSSSVASPPSGSSTSYVDGPLAVEVASASPVDRPFAVGSGGAFRPVALKNVATGGIARTYTAEVIAGAPGGTPDAPLDALDAARYWRIAGTADLNADARVNLAFGTDDGVTDLADVRIAQSASPAGAFASLGGSATGTPSSGTVESILSLTPGEDYFTIAHEQPAVTWDGGASTSNWGDALNWSADAVPDSTTRVSLASASALAIDVNGAFACRDLTVANNVTLDVLSNALTVETAYQQSGGAVHVGGGSLIVLGPSVLSGGTMDVGSGAVSAGGAALLSGAAVTLGTGTLLAEGDLALSSGSLALGSGTLEVGGDFAVAGGSFDGGTGATVFSGSGPQSIGGGVTHHDLVFRGGGAQPKTLTAGAVFAVTNNLTVESTAQLALSAATPTVLTVGGDLSYSGVTGGANLASLTLQLTGVGKSIGGAAAKASPGARASIPSLEASKERVERWLTDPAAAATSGAEADGKPILVMENTGAIRRADIERVLGGAAADEHVVIDLDDETIERNPTAFAGLAVASSPFEMAVTVMPAAQYDLAEDIAMENGSTLSISGRLDCGAWRVGGGGSVSVGGSATLGTASTDPSGLGGTLVNTGTNTFTSGCIIEYGAAGDQTIDASRHPGAAMIYTAGSGTKTLSADLTITGNSGAPLTKGAVVVGTGTTFADAGHRVSFTTSGWANVIVNGAYVSSGSGGLSYESGPIYSNIQAVDGTAFGDLLINFLSPISAVELNASSTAAMSFRNVVFGGTAGTGNAGGTLRLNETGTTNVTVRGDVTIAPGDTTLSGGGFGGTASSTASVTLLGDLVSTSAAAAQPIMDGTGTNVLEFGGSAPQTFTLATGATVFTGSTMRIENPAGVVLGESGVDYTVGDTLALAGGNLVTGPNAVAIAAGGALIRTNGHVVGALRKPVPAGTGVGLTFEVGTGADYAPVDVQFGNVATGGVLTASTTAGDHPDLAASGIDTAMSVNRLHTLALTGAVFDTASATFHFVPADVDTGADPSAFVVRRRAGGDWFPTSVGARMAVSTQATGLDAFGEFALGLEQSYLIHASAGDGGAIVPSGGVLVPPGGTQAFAVGPDSCHYVADVLVDGASVGADTSYTFEGVHESHTISATFAQNVYTLLASAGPGGTIAPSETLTVSCDDDMQIEVVPDSCYHVADVLVDGNSVGAVTSYMFQNVTSDHTLAASFGLDMFTISAFAGAGGSIDPAGDSAVGCGDSLSVTIAPDSCHAVADVLVDGGSVGSVSSYTFHDVGADHTIAASFSPLFYTIDASAGPGGSIGPSGAVPVECGDDREFSISPDPGFAVENVWVDTDSIGPVSEYTFVSVTGDHTIEASFGLTAPNVVTLSATSQCISVAHPCLTVPVRIYRTDATPVRAYSVILTLSPELALCPPDSGIVEGDYFGGLPTSFHVVDLGGGSYRVDAASLGWPCDADSSSGTLFTVRVGPSGSDGSGTLAVSSLTLRDCVNDDLACGMGPLASIEIDLTPPTAVADLAATQVKTGNDADGTTKIGLAFTSPFDAAAVEVYRAPFGTPSANAYPEYDDESGAGAPAAPSYPPGAPWSLTAVTAGGQTDEPSERGFWSYAAFSIDACGNASPASAPTGGTLNYFLGDTHDAVADCSGDNTVSTSDVSFLGAHYGDTLSVGDSLACMDVGPTTDLSTDARPTTDNVLDFEDLMMFTLNYEPFSSPGGPPAASDEVTIVAPSTVTAGQDFDATLGAQGTGDLRGVSFRLSWNAAVATPVSAAGGALLADNGAVAFSPAPGALDAGILSVDGLLGEGTLATVSFHAIGTGDPQIAIAALEGRDEHNAHVDIGTTVLGVEREEAPRAVELLPCVPNPFNPRTTIAFRLPVRAEVDLAIFAVNGRLVRVLASGPHDAGEHRTVWDGRDARGLPVSSGIYFARLRAAGVTHTRGLTLLK